MDTHWLNLTLRITVIQKKSKYDLFDWEKSEMTSYFRKSVKPIDLYTGKSDYAKTGLEAPRSL